MKKFSLSVALVCLILSSAKSQQKIVESYLNANHSTSKQRQDQRMILPPNQSESLMKSELPSEAWQDNLKEYNPYYTQAKEWANPEMNFHPTTKPIPTGDINGDGFDDFVTYNGVVADERTTNKDKKCYKTILFYGNNTGGFTTKLEYKKIFPAGDINNDGYADLFFQEYEKNTELHFGSANGFVKADISFEANISRINYTNIDLNRDGFKDCVFLNLSREFKILFGHSDPQKIEEAQVVRQFSYYGISLVESDTKSYLIYPNNNEIISIEINSDKSLNTQSEYYTDHRIEDFCYVDIDNDGKKEFFGTTGYKYIFFKEHIPGGKLAGLETLVIDERIRYIGDLNQDNIPEFAHFGDNSELVNISIDTELKLHTVCTIGSVIDGYENTLSYNNVSQIINADYNNDNKKELIAFDFDDKQYIYRSLSIEGGSPITYNKIEFDRTKFDAANYYKTCNLGDINGDGLDDIALYNNLNIDIYTNGDLKTPAFSIPVVEDGPRVTKIAASDMNNDGFSDWIVGYRYYDYSRIDVYYGSNKPGNKPSKQINIGNTFNLDELTDTYGGIPEFGFSFIGSVDGDKYPELIMFNTSERDQSKVFIFKGGENLPDQPTHSIDFATNFGDVNIMAETFGHISSSAISLGDINNDGINDFVLSDADRKGVDYQKKIEGCLFVFYGKADLNFTTPDKILYNQQYDKYASIDGYNTNRNYGFYLTAGDYNGDGVKDIAVAGARFTDESNNAATGVDIYYGGENISDIPNKRLFVKAENSNTNTFENLKRLAGLTTVPDLNGDQTDELIITIAERNFALAYLHTGSKTEGINENPVGVINNLTPLSLGLGAGGYFFSRFPLPIARFSQTDIPEFISISYDPNYPGNPVSFYRITDPVNVTPTDITLTGEIKENSPANTLVGELNTVDENSVDYHTYQLIADESGNAFNNDLFELNENKITAKQTFDFETHPTYQINVKATDASEASITKLITIKVLNVNEAPTALALSNSEIEENAPIGTVVGTLSAVEVDKDDVLTYTIVENENFKIEADELLTKSTIDYETQKSYSIKLIATDANGLKVEKEFSISISDVNEAPEFISEPSTSIKLNLEYIYEIGCFDIDGDDLTVEAIKLPNWLTLSNDNDGNYILSGTPEIIGDYDVVLSLTDGEYTIKQEFKIATDYILGIEEVTTKQSVSIYPNPVVDELRIDLSDINSEKITISLISLTGNQIFKETHHINFGSLKIQKSVQNLKPGMYLLLIESGQNKKGYKIIKR